MEANKGREPDVRPDVQGASRGKADPRDAERAEDDERAEPSTEYRANADPDETPDQG